MPVWIEIDSLHRTGDSTGENRDCTRWTGTAILSFVTKTTIPATSRHNPYDCPHREELGNRTIVGFSYYVGIIIPPRRLLDDD